MDKQQAQQFYMKGRVGKGGHHSICLFWLKPMIYNSENDQVPKRCRGLEVNKKTSFDQFSFLFFK